MECVVRTARKVLELRAWKFD
jgi:hypothetical protein